MDKKDKEMMKNLHGARQLSRNIWTQSFVSSITGEAFEFQFACTREEFCKNKVSLLNDPGFSKEMLASFFDMPAV